MNEELENYLNEAREEGFAEGYAGEYAEEYTEEYVEGLKEGIVIGINRTRKEERMRIAKRLLEDGTMPLEKIARYTKLTRAKIKELQDQSDEETELQVQLSALEMLKR